MSATHCLLVGAAVITACHLSPAMAQAAAGDQTTAAAAAAPAEQDKAAASAKKAADDVTAEILNNTAPAFTALGVSGQTITDPEGLKKAGLALLNGTDADGNAVTGIGVQFSLAQLLVPVPYHKYLNDYGAQAFARLQITAAYAKGTSGDAGKPQRLAVGAIWVPFDTTDPFANKRLDKCLNDAWLANPTPAPVLGQTEIPNPKREAAWAKCRDDYGRTPTSGISSQVGFATLFRSRDGGTGPLVSKGFAASGVISIGLDCLFKITCGRGEDLTDGKPHVGGKLLLGAVFREHELVVNPLDKTKYIDRNRQSFGGKLVIGDPTAWYLGFEFLRQRATYGGLGKDRYLTYNASLDIKIAKGIWLNANYGDSSGQNFSKSSQFTAGFKFSLQPTTSLDQK